MNLSSDDSPQPVACLHRPTSLETPGCGHPTRLSIVLLAPYSSLTLSILLDVFDAANRQVGRTVFEWALLSADAGGSGSVRIAPGTGANARTVCNLAVLVGDVPAQLLEPPSTAVALARKVNRSAEAIAAIGTGVDVLARAGLLDERSACVHHLSLRTMAERHRDVSFTGGYYSVERRILTCPGGAATLEFALELVRRYQSRELAASIQPAFGHSARRDAGASPRRSVGARYGIRHRTLTKAISIIESADEGRVPLPELARRVGVTGRQLQRLFAGHLGVSPVRFERDVRLARARQMLLQTDLSVAEISTMHGFSSTSHFGTWFRRAFKAPPSSVRVASAGRAAGDR